jgi:hypothetical protein
MQLFITLYTLNTMIFYFHKLRYNNYSKNKFISSKTTIAKNEYYGRGSIEHKCKHD